MVIAEQQGLITKRQNAAASGKQVLDAIEKAIGKYGSKNLTIDKIAKEVGGHQDFTSIPVQRPIRRRKHTEGRREEIIDAVRKVIIKYGSENITTEKIALEVGISQAAIYRHFKSKREIILLLIDSLEKSLIEELAIESANNVPSLQVMEDVLKNHVIAVRRRRGIFFALVAEIVSLGDRKLNKRISDTLNMYIGLINNVIDEGKKQGYVRTDIDTEKTANLLFGAIQGLVNVWTLQNRRFDLELEFSYLWATFKELIGKARGQVEAPKTVLTRVAG